MTAMIDQPATRYESFTSARARFREILDTAAAGRIVSILRPGGDIAVLREDQVRTLLASHLGSPVQMVHEDGAWAAFIPGLPVAAEATSPDAAIDEMIGVLRDYAEDWHDHLHTAPNHAENWPLVEYVGLSHDEELRAWATGA